MTISPPVTASIKQPAGPWVGVQLAEKIELLAQSVRDGGWIDATLGVIDANLDGLAPLPDPLGPLRQYDVSWIIELAQPLTQAFDWLAGDPEQFAGDAQRWRDVAASLDEEAAELGKAARGDVTESGGPAYRDRVSQQQVVIGGLAKAAESMVAVIEETGYLISAVRIMVRDAIVACVSQLAGYAAEVLVIDGAATPRVVEQVTATVAASAAKIARLLRGLLNSLRALIPVVERLGALLQELNHARPH